MTYTFDNRYLSIICDSKYDNYIISVIIGDQYEKKWNLTCRDNWVRYCNKHGIGLAVLHTKIPATNQNIHWQKYLIGSELAKQKKINNLCYLDYDILINPLAENIFENCDTESINLVSQEKNLPYRDDVQLIKKNIAFFRREYIDNKFPYNSSLIMRAKELFRSYDLTPFDDYACMGVFAYNYEKFQSALTQIALKYSGEEKVVDSGDELLINYELQKNYPIHWLHYEWQTLWLFEVVSKYSFLYATQFQNRLQNLEIVNSCLLNCSFLHFAGSWESIAFDNLDQPLLQRDYERLEILEKYRNEFIEPVLQGKIVPKKLGKD